LPKRNEPKKNAPDIVLLPKINLILWRSRKLAKAQTSDRLFHRIKLIFGDDKTGFENSLKYLGLAA